MLELIIDDSIIKRYIDRPKAKKVKKKDQDILSYEVYKCLIYYTILSKIEDLRGKAKLVMTQQQTKIFRPKKPINTKRHKHCPRQKLSKYNNKDDDQVNNYKYILHQEKRWKQEQLSKTQDRRLYHLNTLVRKDVEKPYTLPKKLSFGHQEDQSYG